MLRSGKNIPSEATMIRLAELAGMPKEEALIDLNLWRSKGNPEINKIWQRVAKMIGILIFSLLFSSEKTIANSSASNAENLSPICQSNIYYV